MSPERRGNELLAWKLERNINGLPTAIRMNPIEYPSKATGHDILPLPKDRFPRPNNMAPNMLALVGPKWSRMAPAGREAILVIATELTNILLRRSSWFSQDGSRDWP